MYFLIITQVIFIYRLLISVQCQDCYQPCLVKDCQKGAKRRHKGYVLVVAPIRTNTIQMDDAGVLLISDIVHICVSFFSSLCRTPK